MLNTFFSYTDRVARWFPKYDETSAAVFVTTLGTEIFLRKVVLPSYPSSQWYTIPACVMIRYLWCYSVLKASLLPEHRSMFLLLMTGVVESIDDRVSEGLSYVGLVDIVCKIVNSLLIGRIVQEKLTGHKEGYTSAGTSLALLALSTY